MSEQENQNALDKAKIGLMMKPDSAFFTTIAFSLKHVWDESISTAAVDGVHMFWNPKFFMGMPPEQRIGVMVHEACHIAFNHLGLRTLHPTWCPDILNQAADHVINLMILARGFHLPSFALKDERFKGMHTEQVYTILAAEAQAGKPQPKNPMPDLIAGGEPGEGDGKKNSSGMSQEQLQKHVQDMIVRAAMASKMANDKPGSIPGDIELFLDNLLNPRLPWQTLLRRFFTDFSKNDYSWKRPNRRFFPAHHLPSLHSITLEEVDFYVDISGSVEDYQFEIFVSEIASVLKHHKPKAINIIQFDTKIQHVNKVRSVSELMQVKFHGRGGTHIKCILEHMEKSKAKAKLVITDGGFRWPRQSFRHQILWLINDNEKWQPLYGKAIHFSTKDFK